MNGNTIPDQSIHSMTNIRPRTNQNNFSSWEDEDLIKLEKNYNVDGTVLFLLKKYKFDNTQIGYQTIAASKRDYLKIETIFEGLASITYANLYTDNSNLLFEDLTKEENVNSTVMSGILSRSSKALVEEHAVTKIEQTVLDALKIFSTHKIKNDRLTDFIALTKARILRPTILFDKSLSSTYPVTNLTDEEAVEALQAGYDLRSIITSMVSGLGLEEAAAISEAPTSWAAALVPAELLDNKQFLIDGVHKNVETAARAIRREHVAKGQKLTTVGMQKVNQKANNPVFGSTRLIFSYYDYHSKGWQFTVEGKNPDISSTYSYKYDSIDGRFKETL